MERQPAVNDLVVPIFQTVLGRLASRESRVEV
jgi:hypothetical protein